MDNADRPNLAQWGCFGSLVTMVAFVAGVIGFIVIVRFQAAGEIPIAIQTMPTLVVGRQERSNRELSSEIAGAQQAAVAATEAPTANRAQIQAQLAEVSSWQYQLSDVEIAQVAASDYDLFVTGYAHTGSGQAVWTPADVAALQSRPDGAQRIVLAYMSVGQAANNQFYWQEQWVADAPAWLLQHESEACAQPELCQYRVRYWEEDWQRLIISAPDSYLNRIIDAGFDGVYIDFVDAHQYFEDTEGRESAQSEMVAFVQRIALHARVTRGQGGFMIVPQNGEHLLESQAYMQMIDGIGSEGLFLQATSTAAQPKIERVAGYLQMLQASGKPVLAVDYLTDAAEVDAYQRWAQDHGFIGVAVP